MEIIKKQGLEVTPAIVKFSAYDKYLTQAKQVAEIIRTTEVNEENLKEAKRTLAQARKITDELNARRIEIKKTILKEYDVFEKQVKEISGVITEAEQEMRAKVNAYDEAERERKRELLRETWNARAWAYKIADIIPDAFDRWLTPQHLNKSMSLNKCEQDMVTWLELKQQGYDLVKDMGDEYITEYVQTLNIETAIRNVLDRITIAATVKAVEHLTDDEPAEETAQFLISGKANIKLVEMLLKENEIFYIKKEN